LKDACLSESDRQTISRLVSIIIYKMINLLGEDGIVDVVVMVVVLADAVLVGVDVAVLVVVSPKR